jgi:hypothetical protein
MYRKSYLTFGGKFWKVTPLRKALPLIWIYAPLLNVASLVASIARGMTRFSEVNLMGGPSSDCKLPLFRQARSSEGSRKF